jgi:hypothetical protein
MIVCAVEKEPCTDTVNQIVGIAEDYTEDYFTANVPEDTRKDLQFHRVLYLKSDDKIISFIVFTCLDGIPHITLMATKRQFILQGYGKQCMGLFFDHIKNLGFSSIEVMTVPPKSKPVYSSTLRFYQNCGFEIIREYTELWESGAIKLRKKLLQDR